MQLPEWIRLVLVVGTIVAVVPKRSAAVVVASYFAGNGTVARSPVDVYLWSAFGIAGPNDPQGRSVVDSAGGTAPAWQVTDGAISGSVPQYFQYLEGTALTNARTRGWSMSTTARLVNEQEGPPTMGIGIYFDSAAYLLMIDRDAAANQLRAYLYDTLAGQSRIHTLATGAAAYNYYNYELRYSPVTRLVSLYLEGQLRDTWDGVPSTHGPNDNLFQFGSSTPAGFGRMNFRSVVFATIDSAAQMGDYNGDGVISIADYTRWRDNLGSNLAAADGNGDGIVNQADYTIWRNNYGRAVAALLAAPSNVVPEPAAAALVAVSLAALVSWARRRR